MKFQLLLPALLLAVTCRAQVALEHSYPDGGANRVLFEEEGIKYYYFDRSSQELLLFNEDHTPWKSAGLDLNMDTVTSFVLFHISQHRLFADDEIEYIYEAYGKKNGVYTGSKGIRNLSGDVLGTVTGFVSKVDSTYKLVSWGGIYTLPGVTLEQAYPNPAIYLVDNNFPVYVVQSLNQYDLYRTDHTLWKSIPTGSLCDNCFPYLNSISQTSVDSDSLVELVLSIQTSNPLQYRIVVMKEDSSLLFDYAGGSGERVYARLLGPAQGFQNGSKLALTLDDLDSTLIYKLPGFALEKALNFHYQYYNTGQEGILYYPYNTRPGVTEVNVITPGDYNIWHTSTKPAAETWYPGPFSRYIFDSDDGVEFYYLHRVEGQTGYSFRLVDETDGSLLIDEPNMSGAGLSFLPGAPVKLICSFRNFYPDEINAAEFTKIYSIGASTGLNIAGDETLAVVASPNPGIGDLRISFPLEKPSEALRIRVFDLNGRNTFDSAFAAAESLVVQETAFPHPGIYMVEVQSGELRSIIKVFR